MTDRRQLLGYLGSIMLVIGTFLPLVSLPLVGSMNYFANGNGDGIFIIGYSAVAIVLTALKKFRWLLIPAGIAFAQLTYALINFQNLLSTKLGGLLANAVHLEWAWIVLYLGALIVGVAAILKPPTSARTGE